MDVERSGAGTTDLQGALSAFLFSDSLDSTGMCLWRAPKMPAPVSAPTPGGRSVPLGSVDSGGSSVTASLTATAVVGVIVELMSCSHGVDIRRPVRLATRGRAHLPPTVSRPVSPTPAVTGSVATTRLSRYAFSRVESPPPPPPPNRTPDETVQKMLANKFLTRYSSL